MTLDVTPARSFDATYDAYKKQYIHSGLRTCLGSSLLLKLHAYDRLGNGKRFSLRSAKETKSSLLPVRDSEAKMGCGAGATGVHAVEMAQGLRRPALIRSAIQVYT